MIHITFTGALQFFAIILTFLFTLMLFMSEKFKQIRLERTPKLNRICSLTLVLVLIELILVCTNVNYKFTIYYKVLASVIYTVILLCIIYRVPVKQLLILILLEHLIFFYNSKCYVEFGEWTRTLTKMMLTGHYEIVPERFSYNPFPFHCAIHVIYSKIANIPIMYKVSWYIISIIVLIIIDLLLYIIATRLTKNPTIGVLAIALMITTPPLNLLDHLAELTALMLTLTLSLLLLKLFQEGESTLRNRALIYLTYISGVFYHATAGLAIIVIICIIACILISRLTTIFGFELSNIKLNSIFKRVLIVFTCIVVITLIKWVWAGGVYDVIKTLYNHLLATIEWHPMQKSQPLYVRLGVNPIHAYPWSLPAALALSYVTWLLLTRRPKYFEDVMTAGLAVGGLAALFLGFLSAYLRTGFTGAMYPGYALLMIAAGIVVERLLIKGSVKSPLTPFILIMLIFAAYVASSDPVNMPGGWVAFKKFVIPGKKQLLIASTIEKFYNKYYELCLTHELCSPLYYLNPYRTIQECIAYSPVDPKYRKGLNLIKNCLKEHAIGIFRLDQIRKHIKGDRLEGLTVIVVLNYGEYIGLIKA